MPGKCKHVNFVSGIRFSNVSFVDNFGGGIRVSLGPNLGNASMPIGVRFDDCRVNGTGYSGPLLTEASRHRRLAGMGGASPNAVVVAGVGAPYHNSGEIRFNNLHVANASGGVGLILQSIPARGWATLIFDSLQLEGVTFDTRNPVYLAPVVILGSNPNGAPAQPGDGTGAFMHPHRTKSDTLQRNPTAQRSHSSMSPLTHHTRSDTPSTLDSPSRACGLHGQAQVVESRS